MMQGAGALMPLGIIEQPIGGGSGATFIFARPTDGQEIQAGQSITIWDEDRATGAMARYRGIITEIGSHGASLYIEASDIDPNWPSGVDPIRPGNAVYLAKYDSYDPDLSRGMGQAWEMEHLREMAREFEHNEGISTSGAAIVLRPPPEDDAGIGDAVQSYEEAPDYERELDRATSAREAMGEYRHMLPNQGGYHACGGRGGRDIRG